jgi:hypothetical protein
MGALLRSFTYPRNAFAATTSDSASKALEVLARAEAKKLLSSPSEPGKIKDEAFNDMRLFLAIVGGPVGEPFVTSIGDRFRQLAKESPAGAWRWLLTRSMWLYSIPNGSNVACNVAAERLGVTFNFFDMIVRLLVHFSALQRPENILYFDELLLVLNDDTTWSLSSEELHDAVLESRETLGLTEPQEHASLLDELEPRYQIGRDYMNTVFKKAFGQTGLFQLVGASGRIRGMCLDPGAYENPVLAQRLRFVLDHPRTFSE